ncbi:hypothetical protein BT96DRAFT_960651 [Gymnopus androsaceus JB14]|uniref:CxC2-like cysteine cluster KDZ transposase-associated domain-containing protein n=1 Tax=Gymnopus androsaceus JB14 TaxID=1447944 RepID=A0A6A4GL79_9AGAR|nr:hypothetical protein BT96DRAFT_960651 [Gymnopus androsaceus JB14]
MEKLKKWKHISPMLGTLHKALPLRTLSMNRLKRQKLVNTPGPILTLVMSGILQKSKSHCHDPASIFVHSVHSVLEGKSVKDHCKEGLRVPKSVLDGCLTSFTAADEAHIKGSTRFFNVMANMTLLCCHDRPLFTVNMDTPGEGQHYVLALFAKLFKNLPHNTIIRFLYDISCQLHRSCIKWSFLKPYMSRMTFVYIGCGLSDGKGCEHHWHSLSYLIAYGQVVGGLSKLGVWLHWKVIACESKLNEAEEVLRKYGFPEDVLQQEWDAQIKAQTKPLPCQHKNCGKSAVEEALQLRKSCDAALDYVKDLCKHIMDTSSVPWETATAELELETALQVLRKVEGKVKWKEDSLGDPGIAKLTRKYNRLCNDMATLIRQNKAPCNAIAPVKIKMEGLFDLDVDDNMWLVIGLGYDDDDKGDGSAPPLWLSNDDVQAGIRAMLDRDCCLEECKQLLDERSAMQEWFSEEWKVVTMAMQDRLGQGGQYQLGL